MADGMLRHRSAQLFDILVEFPESSPALQDKLKFVIKATRQHSFNLFKFASLYKAVTIFLRRTNGGKPRSADSFIAGLIGGWTVFGERNAVNEQVSGAARGREEGVPHRTGSWG